MIKRKRSDPDANISAAPDTTQAPVLNQQLQNLLNNRRNLPINTLLREQINEMHRAWTPAYDGTYIPGFSLLAQGSQSTLPPVDRSIQQQHQQLLKARLVPPNSQAYYSAALRFEQGSQSTLPPIQTLLSEIAAEREARRLQRTSSSSNPSVSGSLINNNPDDPQNNPSQQQNPSSSRRRLNNYGT